MKQKRYTVDQIIPKHSATLPVEFGDLLCGGDLFDEILNWLPYFVGQLFQMLYVHNLFLQCVQVERLAKTIPQITRRWRLKLQCQRWVTSPSLASNFS